MNTNSQHIDFYDIIRIHFPEIRAESIILNYLGEVNHEIIKALLFTLEQHFKRTNLPRFIQKKTFNVMVECIQNIEKHTIKLYNDSYYRKSSILVANLNDDIHVISSNVINKQQQQYLIQKENQLKGKSKEELRQLYKQQLIDGTINEKGGAGLGFIDMARRTNNQLFFNFFPINNEILVFTLHVILKK
ncbi:MAG: SiaB family protein kinase [Bacteroidales bacterium]|nr:SiaB family protein kinase [Bacteroidales bacterium]